jgi:hypothetical protein
MTPVNAAAAPSRPTPPPPLCDAEWAALCAGGANALVVGTDAATATFLRAFTPSARQPLVQCAAVELLARQPLPCAGTVILRDVQHLDRQSQERLARWLDEIDGSVQLIVVAAQPLYALVTRGAFLDRLYYRLNGLSLDLNR